jgi:hypothetical protein
MSIVLAVVKDKERFVILAHDQEPSSLCRFETAIATLHQSGSISAKMVEKLRQKVIRLTQETSLYHPYEW